MRPVDAICFFFAIDDSRHDQNCNPTMNEPPITCRRLLLQWSAAVGAEAFPPVRSFFFDFGV